jgi:hypothetical protein
MNLFIIQREKSSTIIVVGLFDLEMKANTINQAMTASERPEWDFLQS